MILRDALDTLPTLFLYLGVFQLLKKPKSLQVFLCELSYKDIFENLHRKSLKFFPSFIFPTVFGALHCNNSQIWQSSVQNGEEKLLVVQVE